MTPPPSLIQLCRLWNVDFQMLTELCGYQILYESTCSTYVSKDLDSDYGDCHVIRYTFLYVSSYSNFYITWGMDKLHRTYMIFSISKIYTLSDLALFLGNVLIYDFRFLSSFNFVLICGQYVLSYICRFTIWTQKMDSANLLYLNIPVS